MVVSQGLLCSSYGGIIKLTVVVAMVVSQGLLCSSYGGMISVTMDCCCCYDTIRRLTVL